MTSIYQHALGADFDRLHPKVQERFALHSGSGRAAIGTGTMATVERGPLWTLPFLYLGASRNILFPEQGTDVPFRIRNWAYVDDYGRETVTWLRTFYGKVERHFDAYMIYSEGRAKIIDYLGTHQHLAVDIDFEVDEEGGLCLRSGAQRLYEGKLALRFPLFLSGRAEVREWYDDELERYRIRVEVRNRLLGRLFRYEGAFDVEWVEAPDGPPADVLPVRTESRD